jgi:hypothetical protein
MVDSPGSVERILEEVSRLRDDYVDCSVCPPYRSCCVFSGRYVQFLKEDVAKAAFGEETFQNMIEMNTLEYDVERKRYMMKDTRCPALNADNSCRIYVRKEELELIGCREFPIYYLREFWGAGMEEPISCVMADYRCSSVERKWDAIEKELQRIKSEMFIPVMVTYYELNAVFRIDPLSQFRKMKDRYRVPPQHMSAEDSLHQ